MADGNRAALSGIAYDIAKKVCAYCKSVKNIKINHNLSHPSGRGSKPPLILVSEMNEGINLTLATKYVLGINQLS